MTTTTAADLPELCAHCNTVRQTRRCEDCGHAADVIDCGHYEQPAEIAAGRRGRAQCRRCWRIDEVASAVIRDLAADSPEIYDTLAAVGMATVDAVATDIGRIADDGNERHALLAECLDGADETTAAEWRGYVAAVVAAAGGIQ